MDRSLPGVLLIALVASSVAYLAFSGGRFEKLSILEIRVPERMYYSDEEYHVIASMVARSDLPEVEIRFHWLRGVDREFLFEASDKYGVLDAEEVPEEAIERAGIFDQSIEFSRKMGLEPTVLDMRTEIGGMIQRVILVSIGPAQKIFLPGRIGSGDGEKPIVTGSYALVINSTGHLAGIFTGYPSFFYDLEKTLISFEFAINRNKSIYQNRTPESSLPRLRDLPPVGGLRVPLGEGDRMDLVISIEGRSLRWWSPGLCVIEIWVDGELLEAGAYST